MWLYAIHCCSGKVNISLMTVNSSTLVILTYPVWDTRRTTNSYNLTCSSNEFNITMSSSYVISAMDKDAMLSLNISEGSTCCAVVLTPYGTGPPSCTTMEMQDTTSIDDGNLKKYMGSGHSHNYLIANQVWISDHRASIEISCVNKSCTNQISLCSGKAGGC